MIIQIGNYNLLIGFDWMIESNAKTANIAIKQKKGRRHIKSKLPDKKVLVGLAPENVKVTPKVLPGALAVAAGIRECLVCHEIAGTDLVWLCAISDGAPLPGFDEILSKDLYRNRASQVMTYYPGAIIIGNIPGAQRSLEDFLGAADRRRLDKLRMRSPLFIPMILGNAAIAAIAISVGVSNYLGSQAELEAERLRMEQEAAAAQMSNALTQQLRQQEIAVFEQFKKEVQDARVAVSNYRDPLAFIDRWFEVYSLLPDMIGSFRLQSFSCNETVCHINWLALSPWSDVSVFDGIEGVRPGAVKVTGEPEPHAPNLKSFTQVVRFASPEAQPIPVGLSHEVMLAQARDVHYRLEPALRRLGVVGFNIPNEAVDIIVQPPKEIAAKTQPVTVAKGARISIVSNGFSHRPIRDFVSEINAPINIEALGFSGLNTPSPSMSLAGIIRTPMVSEVAVVTPAPAGQ